jgi:hypothetical protein
MNLVVKVRVAEVQGSVLDAEYAYPDGRSELHVASSNSGRHCTLSATVIGKTLSCLHNRPVYDRFDSNAVEKHAEGVARSHTIARREDVGVEAGVAAEKDLGGGRVGRVYHPPNWSQLRGVV